MQGRMSQWSTDEVPGEVGIKGFGGAGLYPVKDSICPPEETGELSQLFSGADGSVRWEPSGHQLTRSEEEQVAFWYKKRF